MTLARRLGLAGRGWYAPTAVFVTGFAVGVQLFLLARALGDASYAEGGLAWLAITSLVVILASAVLNVPYDRASELRQHVPSMPKVPRLRWPRRSRKRILVLAPVDQREKATVTNGGHGPAEAARLSVRVHSPLANGPVLAPGETLPITVEANPAELARELTVTLTTEQGGARRASTIAMSGPALVLTERFDKHGPFVITITVEHPRAAAATKSIEGLVCTYREEVGRLFTELKAAVEGAIEIGPQSTPREVCEALASTGRLPRTRARELRLHLEVALYGEHEVERATYEAIYKLLGDVPRGAPEVRG